MELKLKHLEFIQGTITRMAGNSFLLKGWAVTLVGGLLAFTFKEMDFLYIVVSLSVLAAFWLLDSYYLSRERRFVKLYDYVRIQESAQTDFSMDTKRFAGDVKWVGCAFSQTMSLFYGGLVFVHVVIILILISHICHEKFSSVSTSAATRGAQRLFETAISSPTKTSTASSTQ